MHKIASLAKLALVLIVKYLASASSIQLAVPMGIFCPQLLNPMGKSAPILIWTIAFLKIIFAELNLDFGHSWD